MLVLVSKLRTLYSFNAHISLKQWIIIITNPFPHTTTPFHLLPLVKPHVSLAYMHTQTRTPLGQIGILQLICGNLGRKSRGKNNPPSLHHCDKLLFLSILFKFPISWACPSTNCNMSVHPFQRHAAMLVSEIHATSGSYAWNNSTIVPIISSIQRTFAWIEGGGSAKL